MLTYVQKIRNYLTIRDYIFILIGLAVILFAVFYFRREKAYVYVDLTFERSGYNLSPVPPEYWEVMNVEVGDVVYNSLGNKIAVVTDVEKNIWGGGLRRYVELQIKIEAVYDSRTKKYVIDGKPILISNSFTVDLGNSKYNGIVRAVYSDPEDRYSGYRKASAKIVVKFRDIDLWVAENLKNFEQRNSKGETVAKVIDVKTSPAEMPVETASGQIVKGYSPITKDAVITLELPKVLCDEFACFNTYYNTIAVGDSFWADSGSGKISGASIMQSEIFFE